MYGGLGARSYGMLRWADLFSPRQFLAHATNVEAYRAILNEEGSNARRPETQAAMLYLALALDKYLNYCNRSCRWDSTTDRIRSIFDRHDFAFIWSYGEMAPAISGEGLTWAIEQTAKSLRELVALARPNASGQGDLVTQALGAEYRAPGVVLTCKSGDSLDHLADACIDAVARVISGIGMCSLSRRLCSVAKIRSSS